MIISSSELAAAQRECIQARLVKLVEDAVGPIRPNVPDDILLDLRFGAYERQCDEWVEIHGSK